MTRPYRIGLTGSVAAGKSAVGDWFAEWGAARIDADALARAAVAPGSPGLERIRDRWGGAVLAPDGSLDRSAMRRIAFEDAAERRELERIVHAEVRRLRELRREDARRDGARLLVEEIPLLFESDLHDEFDAIVVVDAPRALRAERAERARGWSADEFDAVDRAQLDPSAKRERADHVIVNDGDLDALREEARRVWEDLAAAARGPRPDPGVDARGGAA